VGKDFASFVVSLLIQNQRILKNWRHSTIETKDFEKPMKGSQSRKQGKGNQEPEK
jgi:hypothetical protein